ncbi:hypothetical protein RhiirA5_376548 [Rhizophagus irregularis]|uniref:Uncharacterized protein n=2 Tax=Rhizophagus irregularis TaxID=588596 RepID=A0A2I1EP83_9GLOM|nr:hypothetical protein GLOIN_2v1481686 [Rhizophagus irregularis DAOM 181602=DAOM 197198]PKC08059.1 hypothetical protein RhiirA5_376548 [Rhizophagus irregularis]PKC74451.1 hypothetical protein RhiirA1_388124 [Rhizophagus irregularis]PKY23937.1 hypothetical protein RhiirB3_507266 [Rhizophagus irregularis]POG67248.1 hypothetical protein GLOIN_2v1481686 [Rhizophagus irregularis DAOM 181602=DAOM 197198]|eukprot:XP_025174114.1 hypothetical protein GLOIN_2v1481686 [Rhizophagus irregularis DAOM 181602=DAOM 197198]
MAVEEIYNFYNFRIFMTRFEDFEGDNIFEANNLQAYEELYNQLVDTTEKVLEILKDQQSKRNLKWAKGIKNNFKPLEKMLSEITLYKRRQTMFQTFKDHSYNTLFFN